MRSISQELDALQSELQTLSTAKLGQKQQQMLKQLQQRQDQALAKYQGKQGETAEMMALQQEKEVTAQQAGHKTALGSLQQHQQAEQQALEKQIQELQQHLADLRHKHTREFKVRLCVPKSCPRVNLACSMF